MTVPINYFFANNCNKLCLFVIASTLRAVFKSLWCNTIIETALCNNLFACKVHVVAYFMNLRFNVKSSFLASFIFCWWHFYIFTAMNRTRRGIDLIVRPLKVFFLVLLFSVSSSRCLWTITIHKMLREHLLWVNLSHRGPKALGGVVMS